MCWWIWNSDLFFVRVRKIFSLSYTLSLSSPFSLLLPPQLLDPSYFYFQAKPWWLALAPVYLMGKLYKRSSRRETSSKWAWSAIVCKSQGFMHQMMSHKRCGSNTVSCILREQHKWAGSGVSTPFSLVQSNLRLTSSMCASTRLLFTAIVHPSTHSVVVPSAHSSKS